MSETQTQAPEKKKYPQRGKRLPESQRIAIRAQVELGESVTTVARDNGIKRQSVYHILQTEDQDELSRDKMDAVKSALLNRVYTTSYRAARAISDDKLDQASALQLMTISAIGIDKGRLMEDKSTANVSHRGAIEHIDSDRAKLMEKLESIENQLE